MTRVTASAARPVSKHDGAIDAVPGILRYDGLPGRFVAESWIEPPTNHSMNSVYKEAIGKVRTKIVATLGPASSNADVIGRLVDAGADVFRLNFSHGTHDDHTAVFNLIRQIER